MDGLNNVFEEVAAERASREAMLGRGLTYDEAIGMSHRHVDRWLAHAPAAPPTRIGFWLGLQLSLGALSLLSCVCLIAWVVF